MYNERSWLVSKLRIESKGEYQDMQGKWAGGNFGIESKDDEKYKKGEWANEVIL